MKLQHLLLIFLLLQVSACRTIRELKALTKCEFRQKDISKMDMAGKNLLQISSFTDLNLADAAKIGAAFKQGSLPLQIIYNLEVRNPHEKVAAMEKLDWIIAIDNKDFINGTTQQRVEVQPNGTATLPLSVSFDLRKAFEKEQLSSLVNVVTGLAGENQESSRIQLKIKPRFIIAGITMGYPGFIKVGKTFKGSNDVEK
jgi:LEA14-like dessication related protein